MRQSCNTLTLNLFYRLPVIALCGALFWQSSYPGIISTPLFPHSDKVLHFGAYALLAFLTARSLVVDRPFWSPAKIKIIAILFACLFGLSDEIHQAFVPSRCASVYDLLADCAGSTAGAFFYLHFFSKDLRNSDAG